MINFHAQAQIDKLNLEVIELRANIRRLRVLLEGTLPFTDVGAPHLSGLTRAALAESESEVKK